MFLSILTKTIVSQQKTYNKKLCFIISQRIKLLSATEYDIKDCILEFLFLIFVNVLSGNYKYINGEHNKAQRKKRPCCSKSMNFTTFF